jgi:uncharacterized tellurite resistance protein B-like protein
MNFSFLPEKIKTQLAEIVADQIPISIARSSASVEGKPGEGYVVAYNDKIFIFSRALGERDYVNISADLGNVGSISVKKDGINSFFDVNIGGKKYSMKFSSFEERNLKSIADSWVLKSESTNDAPKVPQEQDSTASEYDEPLAAKEPFSTITGLAAAMMYVASVDDDISKEEDYYIIAMMGNNKKILSAGLAYYKSHSFDELLLDLKGLSGEQKLCFLANMMELGMKDGVLHSSELNLIRQFSNYMNIEEDQYNTIKQVLLIKNKISSLRT